MTHGGSMVAPNSFVGEGSPAHSAWILRCLAQEALAARQKLGLRKLALYSRGLGGLSGEDDWNTDGILQGSPAHSAWILRCLAQDALAARQKLGLRKLALYSTGLGGLSGGDDWNTDGMLHLHGVVQEE